jgi:hypothetical protein
MACSPPMTICFRKVGRGRTPTTFFPQYKSIATEDERIKFSGGRLRGGVEVPGRKKWNDWVKRKWESWKIHNFIVEALRLHHVHPFQIIPEHYQTFNEWPNSNTFVPMALDTIAVSLFGQEGFGDSALLPIRYRSSLTAIVQRSWTRLRCQHEKNKKNIDNIEKAALAAFDGMCFSMSRL